MAVAVTLRVSTTAIAEVVPTAVVVAVPESAGMAGALSVTVDVLVVVDGVVVRGVEVLCLLLVIERVMVLLVEVVDIERASY